MIRSSLLATLGLVLAAGSGCSGGVGNPPADLSVRTVTWYAGAAPAGNVLAVAEADGRTALFTDQGATVLSGGVVVGSDSSMRAWLAAAPMPAAGQSGTWLVGVNNAGTLYRMRGFTTLENISDRYGLAQDSVSALAALGGTSTAFSLMDGIAISDGTRVTRFADGAFGSLAGAGGKAAGAAPDGTMVRVFDSSTMTAATYTLMGARYTAFDGHGRLTAATGDALYAADDAGDLTLRYEAGAEIHGLAASGDRVWFAEGSELATYDGTTVSRTHGANIDNGAKIFPASDGNVWVLARGALTRYASGDVTDQERWMQTMLPVFARACTPCHLPGGSANIDLSTYDAWSVRRPLIRQRVVTDRTMPPAGASINDGDRAAVGQWADAM